MAPNPSRLEALLQALAELRETMPEKTAALRARTQALPGQAMAWARRNWIALWLVPQAVVSVALFFHGAGTLTTERDSAVIATIEGDQGQRRERGDFDFRAAFSGATLRDWEGLASDSASPVPFQIDNNHYLLDPSSVVVFRAPFQDGEAAENRFRILKGAVTTEKKKRQAKSGSAADQTREIPKIANLDAVATAKIYPRLNSHLVVQRPGVAKVAFSWDRPQSGYVALLSVESDQVQYIPISNTDHVHAPIQTDRSYAWQIVSPDREVLEGPFRFQIASGGADMWKRMLTDPTLRKDKGGVDVLLDQ